MAEASPICRGKNLTIETILAFVNAMPTSPMKKSEFHEHTEKRLKGWTQTHSQIARQVALYYESNGICYPRFTQKVSYLEVLKYMVNWAKLYFVPNLYTPSLNNIQNKPTNIYAFLKSKVLEGEESFSKGCTDMFGIELNNTDKVRVYLNNFTDLVISDDTITVNDNILVGAIPNVYPTVEGLDAKEYFDYFKGDVIHKKENTIKAKIEDIDLFEEEYNYISAIKTKPFLILGGFSGTGKSIEVKILAFATCPCDGVLNVSETSPGNYLLISVKPNWHDATDITGFRSSVQNKYYVTDFMRFLVKAKMYEDKNVPFFVCLDEMNLAPVEEYFADFLSVIESRKRKSNGKIVTDPIVPASVFNEKYAADYNIFMDMGLKPVAEGMTPDEIDANEADGQNENFERQDIVDELKSEGLTIPQNVVIIGTVNMDDTTNTFSRKVIDRAMTFETVVGTFGKEYFDGDLALNYIEHPRKGELFISDEVRATEMLTDKRFELSDKEESDILAFINDINKDLAGTPFLVSYRILNETILLYRSRLEIYRLMNDGKDFEEGVEYSTELNDVFDDILMQKVLPRIEGDYEKCNECLVNLLTRAKDKAWYRSEEKIEFMLKRFGNDKSGFTSFWN